MCLFIYGLFNDAVNNLMQIIEYFPSSVCLKTHNVSEAAPASVIRWNYTTQYVGSIWKS
jgi:hypothetical protein